MFRRPSLVLILLIACVSSAAAQSDDIFKPKNIKARMLSVAEWQLAHPNHPSYDWTNGAFYAGVFAAYEATGSSALMTALTDMGEKNGWKPGPRFDHADDLAISQTYIDLYRLKKDRRMIQPTIDTVNRLKTEKGDQAKQNG
ncbi:MAG TPA: glycoside hydrolase family 88 protein, partial [Pyrinomonadaceae bacterium]